MVLWHADDAHDPFGCVCYCFHLSVITSWWSLLCFIRQTTTTDWVATTLDPSFKALLSYPHFPSLPTSSGEELLPIHVSFGCDTIWLVIGWWLCFSGVVRGPLSLDISWYPQSSSQYILYTIYFKLSDLSFEQSSSLSYQDFFHFMCSYNTHLSFSNHYNPWRTYGKAS